MIRLRFMGREEFSPRQEQGWAADSILATRERTKSWFIKGAYAIDSLWGKLASG
jgi:hypothetical protein